MGVAVSELAILSRVAQASGPIAGPAIAAHLKGWARSAIYQGLTALEHQGLIAADAELQDGRARRVFRLTQKGKRVLTENPRSLHDLRDAAEVGDLVEVRLPAMFIGTPSPRGTGTMVASEYVSLGDDDPWYFGQVSGVLEDGRYHVDVEHPPADNFRRVTVSASRLRWRTPDGHAV